MKNSKNKLYPITMMRPSSEVLCGGYNLESIYMDYFGKFLDSDIDPNTIPSVSNMDKISKDIKDLEVFKYPWDVVTQNKKILSENLKYKISKNKYKEVLSNVFVGKDVEISEFVSFQADPKNIIVIDNYSQILPFSFIEGPCYIGEKSKVNSHSIISHSSIGNYSKVGGELEASIISNYSNKQHFGFIGHSYIGEWVNLGGGTSNSDLKNTYGEISISYQNQKINSGEIFFGCIISDYVKTAINTSIYTGKIIGVNSHLYGAVTSNVPAFVNYIASIKGSHEEFRIDEAIKIQERMFKRRDKLQEKEDIDKLLDAFNGTQEGRDEFLKK